ncbi:MAG: hypothetical protein A2521_10400 [Deltaproteobacteria bacterium RIFOXYD12_FULL_57_12]|nr:MAG: hypothetical protein A2521_10400 [Deltaproteobacteria bacterium RIFOXYD12_FULL_57_12]
MRQLLIDELTKEEQDAIDSYLRRALRPGPMEGLFWLPLPPDLLAEAQVGHDNCGPFCFAVTLEAGKLCFELLVRSQIALHCQCIAHATPVQREFVLRFADKLLAEEKIRA